MVRIEYQLCRFPRLFVFDIVGIMSAHVYGFIYCVCRHNTEA